MATSKLSLTPEIRLKRFLYNSTEEPKYIAGDAELHGAYPTERLYEIFQSGNYEVFLNIIETTHRAKLVPQPESIFFALASAVCATTSSELKHKTYTTSSKIIKSSEDLCMFLKFCNLQKKNFSSGVNKVVCSYYMKKDPFALAQEVGKSNGYHSWTHKELIKLAHCRCESTLTMVVIQYILYGLEKAKAVAEGNPAATVIIDHLTKVEELKQCESENRIIELVSELHCDELNQVPSSYRNKQAVWEALIPQLPIRDLIMYLPKLHYLGFLQDNSSFTDNVVKCLTDRATLEESKVHPVEVFIGLNNFKEGGKPLDPQYLAYRRILLRGINDIINFEETQQTTQKPSQDVLSALNEAMEMSFQNPQPTGNKIMVTIDVTDDMRNPCLNNKNVKCLDAATIFTLSLLRVEKHVTVAVFNGNKISIVPLKKNVTFDEARSKLKRAKSGYVLASSAFEWAFNNGKLMDVFIHFIFNHHWFHLLPQDIRGKEDPIKMFNEYRKKMCLPLTKLITFSLSTPRLALADGSSNMLDICGFTKDVPKVVEAFIKGLF